MIETSLDDKRIIVTGGASGIGAATATLLAKAGASPIIIDRTDIGTPDSYAADITDETRLRAVFEDILAGGPIHGLVTCAGITDDAFLTDMTPDQFRRVMEVNLVGTFLAVKLTGAAMIAQGIPGSIVAISSLSAAGNKGQGNYSASKAAVIALIATAAQEWGRYGIRANSVLPGPIETPMLETVPDKVMADWLRGTPLGHIGQPDDIANTALYLLSDLASHVTGQQLAVSGGLRF
jgi:3-oxoacyl-[acyl-carrier protein] reductase